MVADSRPVLPAFLSFMMKFEIIETSGKVPVGKAKLANSMNF